MEFNSLEFFQFDNLIKTRTQFLLINFSEDLRSWYGPMEKMHLDTYERKWQPQQLLQELTSSKVPKEFAIVLLCKDGHESQSLAKELEGQGYLNVYFVKDGYQGLLKEKGVG